MKVKLLVSRAGVLHVDNVGDVIDVGDKEALRLIESGQAVPVEVPKEKSTAKRVTQKAVK